MITTWAMLCKVKKLQRLARTLQAVGRQTTPFLVTNRIVCHAGGGAAAAGAGAAGSGVQQLGGLCWRGGGDSRCYDPGPQRHFVSIHGASAVLCLHDSKLP